MDPAIRLDLLERQFALLQALVTQQHQTIDVVLRLLPQTVQTVQPVLQPVQSMLQMQQAPSAGPLADLAGRTMQVGDSVGAGDSVVLEIAGGASTGTDAGTGASVAGAANWLGTF
jgi:hypothetical protein